MGIIYLVLIADKFYFPSISPLDAAQGKFVEPSTVRPNPQVVAVIFIYRPDIVITETMGVIRLVFVTGKFFFLFIEFI